MKTAHRYVVIEHPAGFNPWDNNPVLIRLFAEAVVVSVTRQALRSADAANHFATQDLTISLHLTAVQ